MHFALLLALVFSGTIFADKEEVTTELPSEAEADYIGVNEVSKADGKLYGTWIHYEIDPNGYKLTAAEITDSRDRTIWETDLSGVVVSREVLEEAIYMVQLIWDLKLIYDRSQKGGDRAAISREIYKRITEYDNYYRALNKEDETILSGALLDSRRDLRKSDYESGSGNIANLLELVKAKARAKYGFVPGTVSIKGRPNFPV